MATKKAYVIMSKESGNPIFSIPHDAKLNSPIMTMSKTKCLILLANDTASYFDEKGVAK